MRRLGYIQLHQVEFRQRPKNTSQTGLNAPFARCEYGNKKDVRQRILIKCIEEICWTFCRGYAIRCMHNMSMYMYAIHFYVMFILCYRIPLCVMTSPWIASLTVKIIMGIPGLGYTRETTVRYYITAYGNVGFAEAGISVFPSKIA